MLGLPWKGSFAGRLDELEIDSKVLRDNPLGDPSRRPLFVYTPPSYDSEPKRRYPSIYVIQGYGGHVFKWHQRDGFRTPYPEAADEVFASGKAPECIVVYVDAWTAYGGSQFVDSAGTGKYHTYLCDEVVAFVDERYRTVPNASHRGIQGKSSGGFGAMITPMLRPDLFSALATHAGDSLYEYCYLPEVPKVVRALRAYDGSIEDWWHDFRSRPPFSKRSDMTLLGIYGVAACFSPGDAGRPLLPFDPHSGALRPEIWQRWLDWDPVRMVPKHAKALRGLKGIWVDAGKNDDFYLDLGSIAFCDALDAHGVNDVRFELFEGTHSGTDHRYPLALAYLAERLSA